MNDTIEEFLKYDINLWAVAKKRSFLEIKRLYDLGIDRFCENYSSEYKTKKFDYQTLDKIGIGFIGKIQRRDIKWMKDSVTSWHSVDRMSVLKSFVDEEVKTEFFLQINAFKAYDQRQGFDEESVYLAYDFCIQNNMNLVGLMCIATQDYKPEKSFQKVYKIATELNLNRLSYGMSNDYKVALDCGATDIRIGTALFEEK